MTAILGSRVTEAKKKQSGAILDCLLSQFKDNNLTNNRFAKGDSKLLQRKKLQ